MRSHLHGDGPNRRIMKLGLRTAAANVYRHGPMRIGVFQQILDFPSDGVGIIMRTFPKAGLFLAI